jgi:hypothetical protein
MNFYEKYLKYKIKYLDLVNQTAGSVQVDNTESLIPLEEKNVIILKEFLHNDSPILKMRIEERDKDGKVIKNIKMKLEYELVKDSNNETYGYILPNKIEEEYFIKKNPFNLCTSFWLNGNIGKENCEDNASRKSDYVGHNFSHKNKKVLCHISRGDKDSYDQNNILIPPLIKNTNYPTKSNYYIWQIPICSDYLNKGRCSRFLSNNVKSGNGCILRHVCPFEYKEIILNNRANTSNREIFEICRYAKTCVLGDDMCKKEHLCDFSTRSKNSFYDYINRISRPENPIENYIIQLFKMVNAGIWGKYTKPYLEKNLEIARQLYAYYNKNEEAIELLIELNEVEDNNLREKLFTDLSNLLNRPISTINNNIKDTGFFSIYNLRDKIYTYRDTIKGIVNKTLKESQNDANYPKLVVPIKNVKPVAQLQKIDEPSIIDSFMKDITDLGKNIFYGKTSEPEEQKCEKQTPYNLYIEHERNKKLYSLKYYNSDDNNSDNNSIMLYYTKTIQVNDINKEYFIYTVYVDNEDESKLGNINIYLVKNNPKENIEISEIDEKIRKITKIYKRTEKEIIDDYTTKQTNTSNAIKKEQLKQRMNKELQKLKRLYDDEINNLNIKTTKNDKVNNDLKLMHENVILLDRRYGERKLYIDVNDEESKIYFTEKYLDEKMPTVLYLSKLHINEDILYKIKQQEREIYNNREKNLLVDECNRRVLLDYDNEGNPIEYIEIFKDENNMPYYETKDRTYYKQAYDISPNGNLIYSVNDKTLLLNYKNYNNNIKGNIIDTDISNDNNYNIISTFYGNKNNNVLSDYNGKYIYDSEKFIYNLSQDIKQLINYFKSKQKGGEATQSAKFKENKKKIRHKYPNLSDKEILEKSVPIMEDLLEKYYSDFLLDNDYYITICNIITELKQQKQKLNNIVKNKREKKKTNATQQKGKEYSVKHSNNSNIIYNKPEEDDDYDKYYDDSYDKYYDK